MAMYREVFRVLESGRRAVLLAGRDQFPLSCRYPVRLSNGSLPSVKRWILAEREACVGQRMWFSPNGLHTDDDRVEGTLDGLTLRTLRFRVMRTVGIEDARKALGDIADDARLGQITYLSRHGRPIAAVGPVPPVPAGRPRSDPQPGATFPVHYTRTEDLPEERERWSCTCGEGGVAPDGEYAYDLGSEHARRQAAPILRNLPAAELAELLRATAGDDWRQTAAVELVIAHELWLDEPTFRGYLHGVWNVENAFEVRVAWRNVARCLGLFDDAVETLRRGGAPERAVVALGEWAERQDDALPVLNGPTGGYAEMKMLRLAASIAADLQVNLFDDTSSLDNRSRGLVLTAIGHLLSLGGNVAYGAAPYWPR